MDDAIVISERLVKDEVFTSLTIEEHIIQCMRTKNGDEEITRDIPNVSEDAKSCLDEDGIVLVGSYVEEGDILVGKILPRGQVDYSAEEKLLQAIFGNKSKNFKDASLRVPHGGGGIVIRVQRFSAVNGSSTMDDDVIEKIKIFIVQKRKIQVGDKLAGCHGNKGIISIVLPEEDMPYLEDGTPIDICLNPQGVPSRMNIGQIYEVNLAMAMREIAKKKMIEFINANKIDVKEISLLFGISVEKVESLKKFVARYLKEQGDKEIDELDLNIILNNVGLTYEDLNYKVANPVFSGANSNDVFSTMQEAGMEPEKKYGKYKLIDGRTGEYFNGEITVGTMNILKLNHMVEDKIHARATGPYSKITQQPLGGKRQNGGQKVGEMEV
jgi:DNA-directed RNA polymerase subunit beta